MVPLTWTTFFVQVFGKTKGDKMFGRDMKSLSGERSVLFNGYWGSVFLCGFYSAILVVSCFMSLLLNCYLSSLVNYHNLLLSNVRCFIIHYYHYYSLSLFFQNKHIELQNHQITPNSTVSKMLILLFFN